MLGPSGWHWLRAADILCRSSPAMTVATRGAALREEILPAQAALPARSRPEGRRGFAERHNAGRRRCPLRSGPDTGSRDVPLAESYSRCASGRNRGRPLAPSAAAAVTASSGPGDYNFRRTSKISALSGTWPMGYTLPKASLPFLSTTKNARSATPGSGLPSRRMPNRLATFP